MSLNPTVTIRAFNSNDFEAVKEIYQQGIETKNATFETKAPDREEWNKKILPESCFIAEFAGRIAGWSALSPVSARTVYSGVCEVSIYIHSNFRGKGVGKILLEKLIGHADNNNIWTLQSGIFPENIACLKLHLDRGFRQVGIREKIGKMNDTWRDTILLERRSNICRN